MRNIRILSYFAAVIMALIIGGCGSDDSPISGKDSGSIMGVVTDYATGDPVANANVSLRPGGETTLTGSDGRFEFLDVKDGDYSLAISKAEYTDLIDDYVIQVRNGKRMRRDVQIQKLPTYLRITDMSGNDISVLDFGADYSLTTKSFNIFNNGTVPVQCQIIYSCNWIAGVSVLPSSIRPGATVPVMVTINRGLLPKGRASSVITVSTNNGSAELTIMASSDSGNPPQVGISNPDEITVTTVTLNGNIINTYGANVSDCGFCLSTSSSNPSLTNGEIHPVESPSSFSTTLSNLNPTTTYYCRAYAVTNLGTGYSSMVSFTTESGLPICGETTIPLIYSTVAKVSSSAQSTGDYPIIETGFCWTTQKREPTIDDYNMSVSFYDGSFSSFLYPLQPNTTYRIRSYATSKFGIAYGQTTSFTTTYE